MKKMNKLSTIAAAALLAGGVSLGTANACEDLGSASELRSELISINSSDVAMDFTEFKMGEEGKCGEGKCGEGKCGEGKCGEKEKGEKEEGEKTEKSEKSEKKEKGEEGKCGENTCGNQ